MYGLINVAIRDLVTSQFGEDKWERILDKSGADETAFIRMEENDDAITYALVGAASEVLELPAEQVLEAFGEYWTLFTAEEGYGFMLDSAGSTLPEFLQNLDILHTRVGTMYPGLQPPQFDCSNVTENSLDLHYRSDRDGLDHLVIGLLKGLGKRFEQAVTIEQTATKADTGKESVFHVTWK